MKPVVIVVPFYREEMTMAERVSLNQLYRVLGRYPIVFVIPERLRESIFLQDKNVETFPDTCLSSRREYSKMLLNPQFYQRFRQYEYMLIYQLDAFVFKDRLLDFCSLSYDYIGAPMRPLWLESVRIKVGNGGFSLRKISSCIKVTSIREQIYVNTNRRKLFEEAEDKFFGYCGYNKKIPFCVPSIKIAADFAVEYDVAHDMVPLKKGKYPMGCHAWSKPYNFLFWKPYLEKFVPAKYLDIIKKEIPQNKEMNFYKAQCFFIHPVLIKRFLGCDSLQKKLLDTNKEYIIWGYGLRGKTLEALLLHMRCPIAYIFDQSIVGFSNIMHIQISRPDEELIMTRRHRVVIGTTKYEKELVTKLEKLGLRRHADYLTYTDVIQAMIDGYFLPLWKKYRHGG